MQVFDWLFGKDQIGWLKTALLTGLVGGLIFGLSGGFESTATGTNKFVFIALGLIPVLLARGAYWAWRRKNLRAALTRGDSSAIDAVFALQWRNPALASYLVAFIPTQERSAAAGEESLHAPRQSAQTPMTAHDARSSVNIGVEHYLAAAGVRDFEGIIFAPARLCTQDRSWPGYVVVADTMLGFFDSADLAVERIEDGSPVMLKLADIKRVRLSVPAGMALDVPPEVLSEGNHAGSLFVALETTGNEVANLAFDLATAAGEANAELQQFMNDFLNRLPAAHRGP